MAQKKSRKKTTSKKSAKKKTVTKKRPTKKGIKKKAAKNVSQKKQSQKKKSSASEKTTKKDVAPKAKMEEELILQTVRGMRDILPGEQSYWQQVRRMLDRAQNEYGFQRIDTPVVEFQNLFERPIGKGTDIVDKEMYTFKTKGHDTVALRPEFTASVGRAYIQHGMNVLPKPIKLFTTGQLYRYDRPQEGRYREHWQANFDILGEEDPILDAQIIQLAYRVVTGLGLKKIQFQVNSIGTPECRKEYINLLTAYLTSKKRKLCQTCRARLTTNPMRILDCKEDKCAQVSGSAPQSIDHLDADSRTHFKNLLEYLDELDLPYVINPRLVRGFDYYTRTVFEIWSGEEGSKRHSLGGGGRYDGLIETLGGESTPAIGFGIGLDRLVIEMKRVKAREYTPPKPRVYLAQLGDLGKKKSLCLFAELEKSGILVAESFGRGALKAQMRHANKLGVDITLIIGQKEALDGTVIVKNMMNGTQETVTIEKVVKLVKRGLNATVKVSRRK